MSPISKDQPSINVLLLTADLCQVYLLPFSLIVSIATSKKFGRVPMIVSHHCFLSWQLLPDRSTADCESSGQFSGSAMLSLFSVSPRTYYVNHLGD